jgi:hypothetical protein
MAYASRTGTRRNLAALRAAGWRLMVSARGVLRDEGFKIALDNGAWTAFQRGEPFDVPAFERAFSLFGATADFVVVPDVVADSVASLALSREWLPRLSDARLALVPVQDGMTFESVEDLVGPRVGVFMGGSTEWKLANLVRWGRWCVARGVYYHVGRVNTARRIARCAEACADSFDGSSVSRFVVNLPRLEHARQQGDLFGDLAKSGIESGIYPSAAFEMTRNAKRVIGFEPTTFSLGSNPSTVKGPESVGIPSDHAPRAARKGDVR